VSDDERPHPFVAALVLIVSGAILFTASCYGGLSTRAGGSAQAFIVGMAAGALLVAGGALWGVVAMIAAIVRAIRARRGSA
jgi:hypothetical protein